MALPPDERRCTVTHASTGERCKAWAVKGDERQLCAGHAGLGVAASPEVARAAQQAGARRRSEVAEERRKTFAETFQRGAEENAPAYLARLNRIVEHGSDADAMKAMSLIMDRGIGRPREHVLNEHVVQGPTAVESIRLMPLEQRRALLAQYSLPAPDVVEVDAVEVDEG